MIEKLKAKALAAWKYYNINRYTLISYALAVLALYYIIIDRDIEFLLTVIGMLAVEILETIKESDDSE